VLGGTGTDVCDRGAQVQGDAASGAKAARAHHSTATGPLAAAEACGCSCLLSAANVHWQMRTAVALQVWMLDLSCGKRLKKQSDPAIQPFSPCILAIGGVQGTYALRRNPHQRTDILAATDAVITDK
jgi:hypothetical protein